MRGNSQVVHMSQYKKRKKRHRRRLRKPVKRFLIAVVLLILILILFSISRCAGKKDVPEETFPTQTQPVPTQTQDAWFEPEGDEDTTDPESPTGEESAEVPTAPTAIPLETSTTAETIVENTESISAFSFQSYIQKGNLMIVHAMGGIDSHAYGNCVESFQAAYDAGHRVFEADFSITADNQLVLWHDWEEPINSTYTDGAVPLYDEFMATDIYNSYTAMSLKTTLKQMKEHPDMVLIMDYRTTNSDISTQVYSYVIATARANGLEDVLDRLVVTVYNQECFEAIDRVYHFSGYLFNLSSVFKKNPGTSKLNEILDYCAAHGIDMITMNASWFKKDYASAAKKKGIALSVYTLNKGDNTSKLFKQGVNAIFTDYLSPSGE